jgi:hypothetical protein
MTEKANNDRGFPTLHGDCGDKLSPPLLIYGQGPAVLLWVIVQRARLVAYPPLTPLFQKGENFFFAKGEELFSPPFYKRRVRED